MILYLISLLTLTHLTLTSPLSSAGTAKFWHISDLHYDPTVETAKRSCVQGVDTVPEWSSEYCDSNLRLIKSAIDAMKKIESQPEFILWTGDSGLHYWDGSVGTPEEIVSIMTTISELLDDAYPNTTVVASLGNHDFVPDNQLPAYTNEIYTNISTVWERLGWFNQDISEREDFQNYGYYTVKLPSGLVATALNTNFYYQGNKVYSNLTDSDPGNQFVMLERLLSEARANGTKVLISAHVPFGVGARGDYIHMYQEYNEKFVSIIRDNSDVIMGSFFGHEHNDAFKIVFNKDHTEAVSAAYLAPSITPWRYIDTEAGFNSPFHNPGIRLMEYNTETLSMLDYTQYYFDLTAANQGVANVTWDPLYTFSSSYEVPDATLSSIVQAGEKFRSAQLQDTYLSNYYCRSEPIDCDGRCRAGFSCAIFEVTHVGAARCVKGLTPRNPDDVNSATIPSSRIVFITTTLTLFSTSIHIPIGI